MTEHASRAEDVAGEGGMCSGDGFKDTEIRRLL